MPKLSPDGTRVAFRTPAPICDLWVHDLARGTTLWGSAVGFHLVQGWFDELTAQFSSR